MALADRPDARLAIHGEVASELQRARGQAEILRLRRLSDRLDAWLDLDPSPGHGAWRGVAEAIGVSQAALYRKLGRRRRDADATGGRAMTEKCPTLPHGTPDR